jgi:Zn-dependent peptidase ImmA (M78 family)
MSTIAKKLNAVLFHEILSAEFGLKMPVKVIFNKAIILDGIECYGTWQAKKGVHIIHVDNTIASIPECLFAIMAHEYVHAWQWENRISQLETNCHGRKSGFTRFKSYIKKFYNVDIVTMMPNGLTLDKLINN